ncbi:rCG46120 [Rattus norvegicus]|uniref:RCG46120 n=1 Tax=Rattus norvegicus TaxID=10116 RepID=A6ICY6_RAT|nr:rCG46120 [Rattus norvegicus]
MRQMEPSCLPGHACCVFLSFRIHTRAEPGEFGNLPIILCF